MIRTAIASPTTPGCFAVARMGLAITPTLEADGFPTRASAETFAASLNRQYDMEQSRLAAMGIHPADRKIPRGFYTDADAAA